MFVIILILAIIGLASLFGATAGTAFTALGAVLLIPIFLFKLFLLFGVLGFFARRWGHGWDGPRHRQSWRRRERSPREERSGTDRFEEWHRLAHAKEEVDSWVPES